MTGSRRILSTSPPLSLNLNGKGLERPMMLREDAVRISLFGTEMYPYGLCCAIGAACALAAAGVVCRVRKTKPGTASLACLLCLALGIVCSRLAFCLLDQEFGSMIPFRAWLLADRGGWSLFGAIGGVMLGAWLSARISGEKPARILDAASVGICLFIVAERLAEGRIDGFNISRSLPEGTRAGGFFIVKDAYDLSYLATYRIAAVFAAVLFLVLAFSMLRGRRQEGDTWIQFLILGGAGGILLESLRYDGFLEFSFVRFQQVLAAVMLVWGLVLAARRSGRHGKGFAAGVTAALVLAVGICIGIEFALDRTSLSHILLYMIMAAAVAVPAVFGFILLRRNNLMEGQNHS